MTTTTKKTRTAVIQVRVDAKTKDKAARFFKRHGLSTSDGMRRLIDRVIAEKDPWFAHEMSSHLPNAESLKTIETSLAEKPEPMTREGFRRFLDEA